MAPDKIWINTDTLNGYHMSNHPLYGEEYLRKDALMEWANKMLQDTADRLDFHGNQAFAQLFDKLNSM